jgi:hypothetical protein
VSSSSTQEEFTQTENRAPLEAVRYTVPAVLNCAPERAAPNGKIDVKS